MSRQAVASVLLCGCVLASLPILAQDRGIVRVPAPIGPQGQMRDLYSGSHALLVGVSRYQDSAAWGSLDSVDSELQSLETALKLQGFDTIQRVDNPTGIELRRAVENFIGGYGYDAGHRLFFFFAGHGHTLDNGERGFFVPRDAPDPARDESGFRRVALSMQQIALWAQEITARHALFAFDSCFSGSIFRTRERQLPQRIGATTAQPVREFLSAGGAGEPVPARSVFTPVLVRALNGEADLDGDGFVTGTELGNYVQREVIEYRTGQTPQFGKIRDLRLDRGDIVFLPTRTLLSTAPQPVTSGAVIAPAVPSSQPPANAAEATRRGVAEAQTPTTPAPERSDLDAIDETLNEYRRAYEALDFERLLRVYPSLPNPPGVRAAFAGAREVLIGMSRPQVRIISATEATATTRLNQNFVPKVGTSRSAPTREVTFTLQKTGERWVIASLR
jgi:hypothetical protein